MSCDPLKSVDEWFRTITQANEVFQMAMKLTFFFNQRSYGWTESWVDSADVIGDQLIQRCVQYCAMRVTMLAAQSRMSYVRISFLGKPRQSFVIKPTGVNGVALGGTILSESDIQNATALCVCKNPGNAKTKLWYIRGVPDNCIKEGGEWLPTAAFIKGFADTKAKITETGWGWWGATSIPFEIITAITAQPSGQNLIAAANNYFAGVPVGTKLVVRLAGCTGCPNMNGQQTVIKVTDGTALTLKKIPIFPYLGGGTITKYTRGLVVFNEGVIERAVERKTGRPSFQSAGRRKAKPVA